MSRSEETAAQPVPAPDAAGVLKVHFIDVGQGDSILIQSGTENMLVDAGTNESGPTVTAYLQSLGVTKLSYLIGTHPHEDHIGGMDDVIHAFDIGTVIMPDVSHTTRTYEDVLDALLEKELRVTRPEPGDTYSLGEADFTILSPATDIAEQAAKDGDPVSYTHLDVYKRQHVNCILVTARSALLSPVALAAKAEAAE